MKVIKYKEDLLDVEAEANYLHQKSVSETAPLHTHEFYEIFLVINGRAVHIVNNYVQKLQRGSLVWIRPSDIHCYDFYKTYDFEFINLSFPRKSFKAVRVYFENHETINEITNSSISPLLNISEYDTRELENKINHIAMLIKGGDKNIVKYCFKTFLVDLIYKYYINDYNSINKEQKAPPDWLEKVLLNMQHYDNFSVGLERMIELSNCSQEHLTRECKKYLGLTPTQIINDNRLNYAAYLLKTSDKSVINIYQDAGFNNLSHFYHLFKKAFNCSPKEFIKI